MDKNQTSQGTHAGVLFTRNRQFFGTRFFILALFLALGLTSLPLTAFAQSCFDQCQAAYVWCLTNRPGPGCDDNYDACIDHCP
jgi:hypothetical protein